ncbi:3-oxoacyl-[acyl-carrier-protein] synthase III C-terminal domain-containing protein [Actinosynnema sp. NPDC047251]|uniref:Putative beta-ketoacyl synthase III n=1 Tax=Saccharothrix espanaensis (strain ATCC 51144 / DSM 44229 / JCM 9112 / NBRC 15066 / NRRL 15764) TaxID=1179773 RepID=K0K1E4_SACES|nr:3-oxoacyl-[acyl-carrier-protein] synthase III C-terminal domain-containing protein [Saccharothrix espanaensis]CCH30674.1 putative beta-ketoacyl synthase III [Saccharothrix espanaensis DSM 44229]
MLNLVGRRADQADRLIPHQAIVRIPRAVAYRLGLAEHSTANNIDRVGNTGAASIPLVVTDAPSAVLHRPEPPPGRTTAPESPRGVTVPHHNTTGRILMTNVLDRITALLTDRFNIPAEEIRHDISFAELEIDSLTIVELGVTLGEELGIKISDDELNKSVSLDQAAALIQAKIGESTEEPAR